MTLFARVARSLDAREPDPRHARLAALARAVLDTAQAQGLAPCSHTEARLHAANWRHELHGAPHPADLHPRFPACGPPLRA